MTNAALLAAIGEIDGITLQWQSGDPERYAGERLVVYLEIWGRRVELIRDSNSRPDHHLTREGFREVLHAELEGMRDDEYANTH